MIKITSYFRLVSNFFVTKIKVVELIGYSKSETKSRYLSLLDIYESIDSYRGTVVLNYKWTPKQVKKLEFQSDNYEGLFFIYNSIITDIADFNSKKPKK